VTDQEQEHRVQNQDGIFKFESTSLVVSYLHLYIIYVCSWYTIR